MAWFKDGVRTGVAWEFKAGGGAVVGVVYLGGSLSGSDVVYVYPDMWTVVAGKFDDGQLVRGYESRLGWIDLIRCNAKVEGCSILVVEECIYCLNLN